LLRHRALVCAVVVGLKKIMKAIVERSRCLADLRKPECFRRTGEAVYSVIRGILAFGVPASVRQISPRI